MHEELGSVAEALKDTGWRKVIDEDMGSIEENQTWPLVDLPRGHKPVGLK
jgi:hypothetical protein